jgi:hypothetical protein
MGFVLGDIFRIKHTPPGGKSESIVLFAQQFAVGPLVLFLTASVKQLDLGRTFASNFVYAVHRSWGGFIVLLVCLKHS